MNIFGFLASRNRRLVPSVNGMIGDDLQEHGELPERGSEGMSDGTKLYHEMDWAARRWDWFNEGRIVEPRSFCQFWRTVLLYATAKQFLGPLARFLSVIGGLFNVPVPLPRAVRRFMPTVAKGGWFVLRVGGRIAWFLTYSLRSVARRAASPILDRAVSVGKRINSYEKQHTEGFRVAVKWFLIVYVGVIAAYFAIVIIFAVGVWALVGAAGLVVGSFAAYGFFKSGAPGRILDVLVLLSDAASAAKHGVCPPVRIIRAP